MTLDSTFHPPYIERLLELMATPTPYRSLLVSQLLHHPFLAHEQVESSMFYAENSQEELSHTNLITFWWRYPYSSTHFHNKTPEGLSFLLDLYRGNWEFTQPRKALVTDAMAYLIDTGRLSDPQKTAHLRNEKDKLLKRLQDAMKGTYTMSSSSSEMPRC